MAWFSDYTEAPEIILEESKTSKYVLIIEWGGYDESDPLPKWKHTITSRKIKRPCLTYSAAQSALTFYQAQEDTTAIMRRVDASGQYEVEATTQTEEFTYEGESEEI
jgi:hypothetical protein